MNKQKKLIIFAGFAPSLLNFRKDLIKAFCAQGMQVIALAPANTITDTFAQDFKEVFPEVALKGIVMQAQGMNPLRDLTSIWALRQLFKKEQPDYLLAYTIKPVIYGSLAAKLAGVPHIFSLITGLGTTFLVRNFKDQCLNKMVKLLYKIALKVNERVIFQNPDDRNLFIQNKLVAEAKTALVPGSGVDTEHFQVASLPANITFLFIGRLLLDKGVLEFIEAAKLVKKIAPQVNFIMLGGYIAHHPRALAQEILRCVQQEGIIEYVMEVKDVRAYIAKASVLVLPSYREGLPRSPLEAMAMGRPIIVTDVPGCREVVVHSETGFKVGLKNIKELSEAMVKFIQDPALCEAMGKSARAMVEARFNVTKVNEQMLAIMGLANV